MTKIINKIGKKNNDYVKILNASKRLLDMLDHYYNRGEKDGKTRFEYK